MGRAVRREPLGIMIVPDKYWVSSYNDIKYITKESDAKKHKRNNKI
jgi:hypothetical protein